MYMNENSQPSFGKISVHGDGVGAPTPELIEQRAREIALMGIQQTSAPEEIGSGVEVSDDEHEIVPESPGHRAPRPGFDEDDETLGQALVTDGLEEAAHDQMLEARLEDLEADET